MFGEAVYGPALLQMPAGAVNHIGFTLGVRVLPWSHLHLIKRRPKRLALSAASHSESESAAKCSSSSSSSSASILNYATKLTMSMTKREEEEEREIHHNSF
jgi:hypothetical protein